MSCPGFPQRRFEPSSNVRAFDLLGHVPPNHTAVWIGFDDDRHWPHLKPGEYAVIDCTETGRKIVFGELYLVRQGRGPMIWLVSATPDYYGPSERDTAMLRPLNGPRSRADGSLDLRGPMNMSDGPIYLDALEEQILGRVVGVLSERRPAGRVSS